LGRERLATGIVRTATRFGSGRADYAQLGSLERRTQKKTTQSLIPASDFKDRSIHVIFFDDMVASGATVERAERKFLSAGALSFRAEVLLKTDSTMQTYPGVEHKINTFQVGSKLDESVAKILMNETYQPVQRMLRLLLSRENQPFLNDFLNKFNIPTVVLIRIYRHALANDYLSLTSMTNIKGHGVTNILSNLYAQSLINLGEFIDESRL
jgi:hypothetical protein